MVVILLLLLWLNTTALPAVLNVPQLGIITACLAMVCIGLGWWRSRTLSGRYRGRRFAVGLLITAIVSGLWFVYDGYLSFGQEEVSFQSSDATLAGTLYTPTGTCPCPAAVLIHGSGAQTRDEYRYYARNLAQQGIIGLAYDKRGTGDSTGGLYASGYQAYADDAAAAVQLLRQRGDVAQDGIGLIGFSEGEWVVPLAADATGGQLAFSVVVGPSGLSPAVQVNSEIELRLRAKGYDDTDVEKALTLNQRVLHFQRTGQGRDQLLEAIHEAREEPWFAAAEDIPWNSEELGTWDDYAWWRSVMDTRPESIWQHVDHPVLFIKGGRDAHSSADQAESRLKTVLARHGNLDVEFITYPDADHMMLEWPFGQGVPPPVFADGYLQMMIDWLHLQTD